MNKKCDCPFLKKSVFEKFRLFEKYLANQGKCLWYLYYLKDRKYPMDPQRKAQ